MDILAKLQINFQPGRNRRVTPIHNQHNNITHTVDIHFCIRHFDKEINLVARTNGQFYDWGKREYCGVETGTVIQS